MKNFKKIVVCVIIALATVIPVRGETRREFAGYFELTAYCICIRCTGIWSHEHPRKQNNGFVQQTASGTTPQAGRTIAVDISVIPFDTEVYIYGVGYRTAEDRGGAIRGNTIDVFKDCHNTALEFGSRRNVRVYMVTQYKPEQDYNTLPWCESKLWWQICLRIARINKFFGG